jgi:pyrroline-5-carboxylate reductase
MGWTFIGGGNMASSLIGGLLNAGTDAREVRVFDVNADQRAAVQARFGVGTVDELPAIDSEDAVVIAVKPDTVQTVCKNLTEQSKAQPRLVLSVAAGVTAKAMAQWLPNGTPIVRTMPNTPALLGMGASALFANEACTQSHRDSAEQLMNAAGISVWVDNEAQLDAVTALSGSGPAYFFYLIEHMINTATAMGLSQESAEALAVQTAVGAAAMARDSGDTPATLRLKVTSKGGTTHAAITTFDQHHLAETVAAAMQAAQQRAIELGQEFGES